MRATPMEAEKKKKKIGTRFGWIQWPSSSYDSTDADDEIDFLSMSFVFSLGLFCFVFSRHRAKEIIK